LISWDLYAQAKSDRLKGLEAKVNQVLKVIENKQRREIMAERNSMRILRAVKEYVDANEKEPVSQQIKRQLTTFFNGDLDNPGPRGTKASGSAPSDSEPKAPPEPARRTDAKDFGAMVGPAFVTWMELLRSRRTTRAHLRELAAQSL
jgi:DNA polymerase III gamma/tau subunit